MAETVQFNLKSDEIPTAWYNILPDMAAAGIPPLPPLHPGTHEPVTPDLLLPLFPEALVKQEVSSEPWIEIPGAVLDVYRLWRPTPLYRARRLEQALKTPAHIYFKYEGTSPVGSHKPNTAVAQAYYNKEAGTKRLTTETGAGQWGSALSMACSFFGLECVVFMVRASYEQKPYRRVLMETFGAEVRPSPTPTTQAGKKVLEENPDSPGSLGIAISEAIEAAVTGTGTKYAIGSVANHVLLHQTVLGQEAKKQMEMAGEYPDVVIGCVGGGSNYAGLSYPFMKDRLAGKKQTRFLACEPAACPTLTKGRFAYDFGDTGETTPLFPMYTIGHTFVPAPVHAGGLRYHGDAPSLSLLVKHGHMEAKAYTQNPVFEAAVQFARTQGIVAGPEPAHAIRAVIDEAAEARESGKEKVILFNLSGHGHFDMQAYDDYLAGRLPEVEFRQADVDAALKQLPPVPVPG
jgi:tryptophan synthase beta chain